MKIFIITLFLISFFCQSSSAKEFDANNSPKVSDIKIENNIDEKKESHSSSSCYYIVNGVKQNCDGKVISNIISDIAREIDSVNTREIIQNLINDPNCTYNFNGVNYNCNKKFLTLLPDIIDYVTKDCADHKCHKIFTGAKIIILTLAAMINFIFCLSAVDSKRIKNRIVQNENSQTDFQNRDIRIKRFFIKLLKHFEWLMAKIATIFHYAFNIIIMSLFWSIIWIIAFTILIRMTAVRSEFMNKIAPGHPFLFIFLIIFIGKSKAINKINGIFGGGKFGGAGAVSGW